MDQPKTLKEWRSARREAEQQRADAETRVAGLSREQARLTAERPDSLAIPLKEELDRANADASVATAVIGQARAYEFGLGSRLQRLRMHETFLTRVGAQNRPDLCETAGLVRTEIERIEAEIGEAEPATTSNTDPTTEVTGCPTTQP